MNTVCSVCDGKGYIVINSDTAACIKCFYCCGKTISVSECNNPIETSDSNNSSDNCNVIQLLRDRVTRLETEKMAIGTCISTLLQKRSSDMPQDVILELKEMIDVTKCVDI